VEAAEALERDDLAGVQACGDLGESVFRSCGIGTRSRFFRWRMFLSANRRPLRRNMRELALTEGRMAGDRELP
jgi:hypothetical protein